MYLYKCTICIIFLKWEEKNNAHIIKLRKTFDTKIFETEYFLDKNKVNYNT